MLTAPSARSKLKKNSISCYNICSRDLQPPGASAANLPERTRVYPGRRRRRGGGTGTTPASAEPAAKPVPPRGAPASDDPSCAVAVAVVIAPLILLSSRLFASICVFTRKKISSIMRAASLSLLLLLGALSAVVVIVGAKESDESSKTTEAARVVRFIVDYPNADVSRIGHYSKWQSVLKKSLLASLRFIDKHWKICSRSGAAASTKDSDCGLLQVTGEVLGEKHYRVNATFFSERDPIRNINVAATSTVLGVVQIGLRGGIFQYTNALKILGKPSTELGYEEQLFCLPGYKLDNDGSCSASRRSKRDIYGHGDGVRTLKVAHAI